MSKMRLLGRMGLFVLALIVSGAVRAESPNEALFQGDWYCSGNPKHKCKFIHEVVPGQGSDWAVNEFDKSTPLKYRSANEVEAWGLVGKICDDGTKIEWSNNTVWVSAKVMMPTYFCDGDGDKPCCFGYKGKEPVAINEFGDEAPFQRVSLTEIKVPGWNISGKRAEDGSWVWSKGPTWSITAKAKPKPVTGNPLGSGSMGDHRGIRP